MVESETENIDENDVDSKESDDVGEISETEETNTKPKEICAQTHVFYIRKESGKYRKKSDWILR